MSDLTAHNQMAFDIQPIPADAIVLSADDKAQAAQWAAVGFGEAQRWQIYRNALALLGVREWLQWRGVQPSLDLRQCSLFNPVTANLLNAAAQVKIGDFQVSIGVRDADLEAVLGFPQILYCHPPLFPHLYIWVQLSEEESWVCVESGLWFDDLIAGLADRPYEWETPIPVTDLWMDADRLLLAFRCQQDRLTSIRVSALSEAIAPHLTTERLAQKLNAWSELTIASESLTPEEGFAIMRSPQLSQQFTQILKEKFQPSLRGNLAQQGVNVGCWFLDMRDAAVQLLDWQRLPVLAPAMRSAQSSTPDLFRQLSQQGIEIPDQAVARYHDLSLGSQSLRLFAMVWTTASEGVTWTLLLVLCVQPEQTITEPVQFEVRDAMQHLATETLDPRTHQGCSFIQVSGDVGEEFWVTLSLPQQPQMTMTLPPFFYDDLTAAPPENPSL